MAGLRHIGEACHARAATGRARAAGTGYTVLRRRSLRFVKRRYDLFRPLLNDEMACICHYPEL